jgi:hypothetical protein
VKGLCEKYGGIVYLTARDFRRGEAAVAELKKVVCGLRVLQEVFKSIVPTTVMYNVL